VTTLDRLTCFMWYEQVFSPQIHEVEQDIEPWWKDGLYMMQVLK
jgi:hypothetical protein